MTGAVQARDSATSYVAAPATLQATSTEKSPDVALLEAISPSSTATALGSSVLGGLVSRYISLQQQGVYTPEVGQKVAEKMAAADGAPISYHVYATSDITATADTSYARMLAYRSDLQTSLAPLLKNKQPEYEIFAYYIQTKDKTYLAKLQAAAQNYRAAVDATARVTPPADAVNTHVGMLNALGAFAATLDTLSQNADDPFASVVALRTYNQAEATVLASFQSLVSYEKQKKS